MPNFITRSEVMEISRQAEVIAQIQRCDRFDALDIVARNRGFLDYGDMVQNAEKGSQHATLRQGTPTVDSEIWRDHFLSRCTHADDVMINGGDYVRPIFESPEEIAEFLHLESGYPDSCFIELARQLHEEGPWQREASYLEDL